MKLTRQHFEFIAATLKVTKPTALGTFELQAWRRVVDAFAARLRETNEQFRPRQFYAACDY